MGQDVSRSPPEVRAARPSVRARPLSRAARGEGRVSEGLYRERWALELGFKVALAIRTLVSVSG